MDKIKGRSEGSLQSALAFVFIYHILKGLSSQMVEEAPEKIRPPI